ncbi:MAG: LysR family transcriptional regulator [Candidatus Heteroscillospira sp.]|jgi:DNA-binding transcriptional LysR family regulator
MDLHKLTYPIMIAKETSLSKAAEKLFITPSALSQYITKEEENLNIQLFVRSRGNWMPTAAGKLYIETAQKLLDINSNMERQLLDMADCNSGQFSLGVTPGRGTAMFANVYPQFSEAYPDISIHLIEEKWARLQSLMLDNTLDLSFTYISDIKHEISPSLEAEVLADEEFVLFVPRKHPVARLYDRAPQKPLTIDLSIFANDKFICMGKDTTLYNVTRKLFDKAGIDPTIIFESTSTVTMHNLVRRGFGIAVLPKFYAKESEHAVYFKITPYMNQMVVAVTKKGFQQSTAMKYFTSLAQNWYRQYDENE